MKIKFLSVFLIVGLLQKTIAQGDGYLQKDNKRVFPIGSYYLPKEDAALKQMVDAGFNLFSCGSKADLDRVHKLGAQGWVPLPLSEGVTPRLKNMVNAVAGHPALAIWEGPDELVWWFTAHSKLYSEFKVHHNRGAWKKLSPEAIRYAKEKGEVIMPNINNAVAYIRSVDPRNLQVWINEAQNSDMIYVGEYMDAIDVTGCDVYPIKTKREESNTSPRKEMQYIGQIAKRWSVASRGKPVWMVLQGFSWSELLAVEPESAKGRPLVYPSFEESRYMAYDVIANGSRGILYWDMRYLTSEECRTSLYALARELNALQPFLTTDPKPVTVSIYQPEENSATRVASTVRQYGRDWMVALINEADTVQMAAIVDGLSLLNGHKLVELYGDDEVRVKNGRIIVRLRPFQVKVFATSRKWEASDRTGRNYPGL